MALPTAASIVSGGLGAYPTIYYDRVALDTLRNNLFMYPACEKKTMPDMSGVAMQIWDYSAMAANPTALAAEGTPAAGQTLTQNVITLSLSNYVDFLAFSNKVVLTAISDTVSEGAALLSFRGAASVDSVIATAVDVAANADTATRIEIADGAYMTAGIARKAVGQLRSKNVQPKDNGLYYGVVNSLCAYDLINDQTVGSLTDLQRYAASLAPQNQALVGIQGARVGNVGGVEFWESNAVPSETNWQSSANSAFHSYIFGKNAFLVASLGKTDLNQKNFSVRVARFDQGNSIDVAGVIAAGASYNFFFGVTKRPGATSGFRRIRSESSIS